eukprot:3117242-Ditylum_brightwellii.AAC.1
MEYLRSLFCAYKTAKDKEILRAIKDKETKWVTGDLPAMYKYKELLDFTLNFYNNRKVASKWEGSAYQKKHANEDTKFLTMMTNLEQLKKAMEVAK